MGGGGRGGAATRSGDSGVNVSRAPCGPSSRRSGTSGVHTRSGVSGLAVIGVVVGELVGGNMGLGYLLVFFEGQGNTAAVFVVIGALTVIGIVAYCAVILLERRILHYMPRRDFGGTNGQGGK